MIVIIVPKRSLKRAVDRNLTRRRIRAALDEIVPGWRAAGTKGKIYAHPDMLTLPFPELKQLIKKLYGHNF